MIYLDTHVVAWLYEGRVDLLPRTVRDMIEHEVLLVSPMVVLELQYLREVGKASESSQTVVRELGLSLGLKVCDLPFSDIVSGALGADWTRDPFDRLIASHAALRPAPLVSADRNIREHCALAVWG